MNIIIKNSSEKPIYEQIKEQIKKDLVGIDEILEKEGIYL